MPKLSIALANTVYHRLGFQKCNSKHP